MSIELKALLIIAGGLAAGLGGLFLRDWWVTIQPHVRLKRLKFAFGALIGLALTWGIVLPLLTPPNCRGGRRLSSKNNMRQICTGLHLYADDPTNGTFPTGRDPSLAMWAAYPKYVTDWRVFINPALDDSVGKRERLRAGAAPRACDIDYNMVIGCKQSDGDDILIYEKQPHHGQRSFVVVDGSAASLPEAEFIARLKKQIERIEANTSQPKP